VGPEGGEVRSLAADPADPRIVYLGTADGIVYRSRDAGRSWERPEPGFPRRDASLDNLVVDATGRLIVGFWEVSGQGGGVAVSRDRGQHFEVSPEIDGESVRALAVTPARPDTWVVGAIGGVFRTTDGGAHWERITPAEHPDLRNVESLALDPDHPGVIYAGTWHLAWKTLDGGGHWRPVSRGMIDDSDVFTLTLDVRSPERLFATACTGIYASRDAGASWAKVHGIPSSSRRTRSFAQDPSEPDVLYAGTTEGLWSTRGGGGGWVRLTRKQLIVNAVLVLGSTLLLGTEGEGVLRSEDGGRSWVTSNRGFSARHVQRLAFHPSGLLLASLQAGRYEGGVLVHEGAGSGWRSWGPGLGGRSVLALAPDGEGALVGTDEGLYASERPGAAWERLPIRVDGIERRPAVRGVVRLAGGGPYLVASDAGLLRSADRGATWSLDALGVSRRVTALVQAGAATLAATPLGLFRSEDGGASWQAIPEPPAAFVRALHAPRDAPHVVLAVTDRGLFRSQDGGVRFRPVGGELPRDDLAGLAVSPDGRRLWVSDFGQGGLYSSVDGGGSWRREAVSGLTSLRIGEVALDPQRPQRILVATAGGGLHAPAPSLVGDGELVNGRSGGVVAPPAE